MAQMEQWALYEEPFNAFRHQQRWLLFSHQSMETGRRRSPAPWKEDFRGRTARGSNLICPTPLAAVRLKQEVASLLYLTSPEVAGDNGCRMVGRKHNQYRYWEVLVTYPGVLLVSAPLLSLLPNRAMTPTYIAGVPKWGKELERGNEITHVSLAALKQEQKPSWINILKFPWGTIQVFSRFAPK